MVIIFCVFFLAAAVTGVCILRAGRGSNDRCCDYLIVLGAGVNGTVPSRSLLERIAAAHSYLQTHPDTICIVSGGYGPRGKITESACMQQYLTDRGIAASRIIQEARANSTRENIAYSLACIPRASQVRIGILSSDYHLLRARIAAKKQRITPILVPAKTTLRPSAVYYFLREIVGVWYYLIIGG